MIQSIEDDPDAPDWATRKCDCGAYLDDENITYPYDGERVCEGCHGAIQSTRQ